MIEDLLMQLTPEEVGVFALALIVFWATRKKTYIERLLTAIALMMWLQF